MSIYSELMGNIFTLNSSLTTEFMAFDNVTSILHLEVPRSEIENFIGSKEVAIILEDESGQSTEYTLKISFVNLQPGFIFD
jgi:hypothetical protein